jgi:tetratricopeptide (TPR) repeat protein
MLREITEALQVLTVEHSLVLVLEDLHWSDPSTVELLAMLARQREAARLLVLGTYRPTELVVTNHPLKAAKQELVARGQGTEMLLGGLTRDAVRSYVTQRLGTAAAQDAIAVFVHRRTEGHPLFIVQMTDYLAQHDGLTVQSAADITVVEQILPRGLRELIEAQLGRLTEDEQSVLAVGSVGGAEFAVASVAASLAKAEPVIEEICERLASRGQFIEERAVAKWPDGTLSGRYGFRHALYQQALYQRLAEARRVRLHRLIGERIEAGHGERANEIAAELAMHFERGQDTERTVLYLQKAGENALQRWAYQEALGHFQKGVEFLQVLPATSDRARREVALQFLLMQATIPVKGHASREVERIYTHTLALCEQNGTARQLFFVLLGLFRLRNARGEYQQARGLGAQCLALAQREHDPALFFPAYYALGASELYLGNFAAAKEYLTQGIRRYDTQHDATYVALYGNANPYNFCWVYAATALWFLGYPDQAVQHTEEMLRLAEGFASPLTVAGTRGFAPLVYHCCRQGARVQEQAEEGIAVATRMGFPFWRAIGLFWRGWALAEQGHHGEGIQQMQQGLGAQRETGSSVHRVHFMILLAEAHGRAGQVEEGLRLLAEAEMEKTEERFYEAELWRLRGELTLQQFKVQDPKSKGENSLESREEKSPGSSVQSLASQNTDPRPLTPDPQGEAEECFQKAIAIARQQQAKSLELRAVMSFVRLRQQQAAQQVSRTTYHVSRTALTEAHRILSEVYGRFTEGFEIKDLREAKALIEEWGEEAKRRNGEMDKD